MLSIKNQKYIFERLLKGNAVSYEKLDDKRFVFTDGVRLFVFSEEQIKFDITKCAPSDKLKNVLRDVLNGSELRPTEEIRADERKSKSYRRLLSPDGVCSIWIEDKFVKDYKTCLFIGEGRKKPVCVLDDYGDLLAAIMPCDIDREDGDEI